MQEKITQINYQSKKTLRPKIIKHKKLHQLAYSLQTTYCSLVGPFRVYPNCFIIGAAKCGTTSLYHYLMQHPNIHPSLSKEPRYFDKYYYRGLSWYRTHYPSSLSKWVITKIQKKPFVVVDATPRYIDHPHTPYRIKQTVPSAKFVVLLRNPIDRAYSHWNMRSGKRKEPLSFSEAVSKESERIGNDLEKMKNDETYYSSNYFQNAYLQRGIYVDKLKHWMSIFPRKQFLIIQSEKLFHDTQSEYDGVLSFFGLPSYKLKDYRPRGKRKYSKPKMDEQLRKNLSEFYAPYNEQLFQFLGTRFDWD